MAAVACAERVLTGAPATVQVGLGLKDMLLQHMLRFKYSVFGALQWKRDMAEYQAAAARFKVQRVTDGFEQARALNPRFPPAYLLPAESAQRVSGRVFCVGP